MISITPYGAAGEVTGSTYLVEVYGSRILVDFGMFQGDKDDDARNIVPGSIGRHHLDAIVVTHGHLDHVGRLPLLARKGFSTPIYCTSATKDMLSVILEDSARIQMSDFERKKKKADRMGRKLDRTDQPLYDTDDVETIVRNVVEVLYDQPVSVAPGMEVVFHEAGHMLGSASLEIRCDTPDGPKTLVFSGDLGPRGLPFLRDFDPPRSADVVVLESTYGDRDHQPLSSCVDEFARVLQLAIEQRGRILVPAFAIGRTQQLLFHYAELVRTNRIEPIPVFVDSPMAGKASKIYDEHRADFDEESTELYESKAMQREFMNVRFVTSVEESKSINSMDGPLMVIASSGMCNAGRILHHLYNAIERDDTHIVIAGFQSAGSLGRKLVEKVPVVRIFGEEKHVRATVHSISGLSAHAGQSDLLFWLSHLASTRPRVVLTHGEDDQRLCLSQKIHTMFGIEAERPLYGQTLSV